MPTEPTEPRNPTVNHVATTVHGRYWVRPASQPGAPLILGFHGYGESAEEILAPLVASDEALNWNIVAVQALHPFYNRKTGSVVASWMTRQDRDLAIEDNATYMRSVLAAVAEKLEPGPQRVTVGFSQGTAMAYRAAATLGIDTVVALAGDCPQELAGTGWTPRRVLIGWGSDDSWFGTSKVQVDRTLLEELGATVEECAYTGGHSWTPEFQERLRLFVAAGAPLSPNN